MNRRTLQIGSRGDDVADWQFIIGMKVDDMDGVFGPNTLARTKEWQTEHSLLPDGIVGPRSWEIGEPEEYDMASVVNVPGIEHLTGADLKALKSTADWIGINVDWLATAISFETGKTFSPSVQNRDSHATGIIQFLPTTALNLGTSVDELKKMSFQQQLLYVRKYFEPNRGKLKSLEDVYLAIFYPKEIGRSPDDVIARAGSKVYDQNAGFDREEKGYITRRDVTSAIVGVLNRASSNPRITIPILTGAGIAASVVAGYGAFKLYQLKQSKG